MRERRTPRQAAGRTERRHSADSATLEEQCHPRKIFVGGLAHRTTTQQLRDHFATFGPVVDAVVLRWPDGRSRGFGYATFADSNAASAALRQNHLLGGREVDVKRAVPGTNKLFVGGLPQNTTAAELREHFEKFGVVSDAVVMIDPATSRSRGFGFICFLPGQEGASAVTSALDDYDRHRIRGKWIEVKSAAPPHKLASKDGTGDSLTPGLTTDGSADSDAGESATSTALLSTEAEDAGVAWPSPDAGGRPPATPQLRQGNFGGSEGGGRRGRRDKDKSKDFISKKLAPSAAAPALVPLPEQQQSHELLEPKKVVLPSGPPSRAAAAAGAVAAGEPNLQQLEQQLLLLQRQQHYAWLQASAAAAAAAAMAHGTAGRPCWPTGPAPPFYMASEPPAPPAGVAWPPPALAHAALAGFGDPTDGGAPMYATAEFHSNLEKLLRQSMTCPQTSV